MKYMNFSRTAKAPEESRFKKYVRRVMTDGHDPQLVAESWLEEYPKDEALIKVFLAKVTESKNKC